MLYNCHYICYDLETSGLNYLKNQITQVGLIVTDSFFMEKMRYETFIKPYNDMIIEDVALKYCGFSLDEIISKGVEMKQVYLNLKILFQKFKVGKYQKPVLVGHNIGNFDNDFLEYLFILNNDDIYNYVEKSFFDTIIIARVKDGISEVENYKLSPVCERMGLHLIEAHHALNDAEITLELFKKYVAIIRNKSTGTSELVEEEKFRDGFQF